MDESKYLSYIVPWIGLIGVVVGAILNFFFGSLRSNKEKQNERKICTFFELSGLKITITNLYYSCYEAQIYFEMHKRKWIIEGVTNDSPDKEETILWMNKANARNEQLTSELRTLYEIIANARIAYKKHKELCIKIDEFSEKPLFYEPVINVIGTNSNEIEMWGIEILNKIKLKANERYWNPLDEILQLMKRDLK